MGTTSIWSTMGHYHTAICLVPIQASTPEVVDRGITVLRLLEESFRGAEVVVGIATWGYACGQPGGLNLLRLLVLSPQLLYNAPSSEGGDVAQFILHP